jgi:hypothetical protein
MDLAPTYGSIQPHISPVGAAETGLARPLVRARRRRDILHCV